LALLSGGHVTHGILAAALVCCVSLSNSASAGVSGSSANACAPWSGRYSGEIPEQQSAFDHSQQVTVIIEGRTAYVAIGETAGDFDASGGNLRCTGNRVTGTLDTGAGGTGKVSVSLRRKAGAVYLRLFGYNDGDGLKNQAEYLPSEKFEIALKQTR
jgi:hypothetical protein